MHITISFFLSQIRTFEQINGENKCESFENKYILLDMIEHNFIWPLFHEISLKFHTNTIISSLTIGLLYK